MSTTNTMNDKIESTYVLLVRSEEKGRGVLEIAVYVAINSECRLFNLAVRADARDSPNAWN